MAVKYHIYKSRCQPWIRTCSPSISIYWDFPCLLTQYRIKLETVSLVSTSENGSNAVHSRKQSMRPMVLWKQTSSPLHCQTRSLLTFRPVNDYSATFQLNVSLQHFQRLLVLMSSLSAITVFWTLLFRFTCITAIITWHCQPISTLLMRSQYLKLQFCDARWHSIFTLAQNDYTHL